MELVQLALQDFLDRSVEQVPLDQLERGLPGLLVCKVFKVIKAIKGLLATLVQLALQEQQELTAP